MGLNNELVEEHMNALFGKERADALRAKLVTLSAADRELTIVEELCSALNPTGERYVRRSASKMIVAYGPAITSSSSANIFSGIT